ncbi:hypothetical protein [Geomesophilobacter sediminis]|uniref:3-keto-disaccharide hydrolase domain-containing protein n=1 Tax=Geomesophilobacter sediminis TaxID=2798584 RepID=A0A8J7JLT0_9BACT|nr:hypothetical protein [Geomesophilobacter sediminis]MBJ6725355.1 hypothetical protein [Geomesophilobacter sediminis]
MPGKKILAAVALLAAAPHGAEGGWDFDRDRVGATPSGYYVSAGQWRVKGEATAPSPPNVLAQLGRSSTDTFNLTLVAGARYRDVELSVMLRPVGGEREPGGGVVWRAQDARNYYLASYDPLAGDFTLAKVHNFGRVVLRRVATHSFSGWHALRVTMNGDRIECYLDGTRYLELRDQSFPAAGEVGLWTRGDAVTYFDDFAVTGR